MKVVLGVDTSCYTTSAALCALSGAESLFFQKRRLLTVPQGERGLMQSEALFQHVTRLPQLIEELLGEHPEAEIAAVCASTRPRAVEDSYMPVFRGGEGVARSVAACLKVPFYQASHQQGHLRAARLFTPLKGDKPYLGVHLSGGTTEVLKVSGLDCGLLGGTRDLHAGQLIDRTGVAMGLPFPAGPHLEKLAAQGKAEPRMKTAIRQMDCHLSGAETQALAWLESGEMSREDVAAEVFSCIARTVSRVLLNACEETGLHLALLGGGVTASSLIREEILRRTAARNRNLKIYFARPELSGDNAVGTAFIGKEYYTEEFGYERDCN